MSERVLPSGTVTFLFSDVVGSTAVWDASPEQMRVALEAHDAIVGDVIAVHGGYVFATGGDGFCVAFSRAGDAVAAAVGLQQRLSGYGWDPAAVVRVRVGLHTGEAFERNGDFFGPAVNRAARLMNCAHGGQIVCSDSTERIVHQSLPEGVTMHDLGEVTLRGLSGRQQVFGIVADTLPRGFPALRSESIVLGNLPPSRIRLIGRSSELSELTAALLGSRVVTLSGPGGVGKTSLATEAGERVADKFPDGVWFVDLATVLDGAEVTRMTLAALGVQEQPGAALIDTLVGALMGRRMLVLLDNCEHVRGEIAAIVDALRVRPSVVVLATSRERLGVPDEHELLIRPLAVRGDTSPAVELFVERAGLPDLVEDPIERAATVEICDRLDGLPLAIELAAARCRSMRPSAISARLGDSLRLLTDRHTTDPRRATIEGMLRWSYDLLDEREQTVLRRLAVFVGYFDLEAAERVAALDDLDGFDVDDALASLVDKSLVDHDNGWYRLLESTRQFAQARLADSPELIHVHDAHIDWVRHFTAHHDQRMRTHEEPEWALRFERLWPNVRAAYERSLARSDPTAAFTIPLNCRHEIILRRSEALDWFERGLQHYGRVDHPLLADQLACVAALRAARAQVDGLRSVAEDAIQQASPRTSIDCFAELGLQYAVLWGGGDPEAALQALSLAIESTITADNTYALGSLLAACGTAAIFGAADRRFISVARRVVHDVRLAPSARCTASLAIALAAIADGQPEDAHQHFVTAQRLANDAHSPTVTLAVQGVRSWVTQPTVTEAASAIRELVRAGHLAFAWTWTPAIATNLQETNPDFAARLLGAAESVNPGARATPMWSSVKARLSELLGDQRLEELAAEGAHLGIAMLDQLEAQLRPDTT